MDSPLAATTDATKASSHRLVDCESTTVQVNSSPERVIAKDIRTWSSARLPVLCSEALVELSLMRRGDVPPDDRERVPCEPPGGLQEPDEALGWFDDRAVDAVSELAPVEVLTQVTHSRRRSQPAAAMRVRPVRTRPRRRWVSNSSSTQI